MKHSLFLISQCSIGVALFAALFASPQHALAQGDQPATVALLPFEIHSSRDISYLQDGIRNMLASRLSANAGVDVVDKDQLDSFVKKQSDSGLKIPGADSNTDYLISGSITSLGSALSIDAKVIGTGEQDATQIFNATANNDNEVIPAIETLAAAITARVFGTQTAARETAAQPALPQSASSAISLETAHPDRAFIPALPEAASMPVQSPIVTE
jgi:TolB-like protein